MQQLKREKIFIQQKITNSTLIDETIANPTDTDIASTLDVTTSTSNSIDNDIKDLTLTPREAKLQQQSLLYLNQFIQQKDWKFNKLKQVWILQNMYFQHLVDNNEFKMVLIYLKKLSNGSRLKTRQECKKLQECELSTVKKRCKKILKLL